MKLSAILILCSLLPLSAIGEINYYKDIRPVIEQRCINCHSNKGVSFSFEDPEQTLIFREAIVSAVEARRMPPWLAEAGHQTYIEDESLTKATLQKFSKWKLNGYKRGSSPPSVRKEQYFKSKEKFIANLSLNLLPNDQYLPNQKRKDDYRCFTVDWPEERNVYVTGFKALPGNLKVSHHLVAFVIAPEVASIFKYLDKHETGPGYQCFGGAVPDRLDDEPQKRLFEKVYPDGLNKIQAGNFWLAHWAPGMNGYSFPEDTGILVRPGSLIVLQMHYYSAFAPGESDSNTKIEFQLANKVRKPSINFPLTSNKWLNAQNNRSMVIPSGKNATFETSVSFSKIAAKTTQVLGIPRASVRSLEVHSANIHMHSYGASAKAYMTKQGDERETLLLIPRWDLDWQRDFTFSVPKRVESNQFVNTKLNVECHFVNPSNKDVFGGYGSDDEMCFNFSYISVLLDDEILGHRQLSP